MAESSEKMMLSLALHNHQPVGNFGWVFAEGYKKAYLPMVEALERHPGVRLALHYSGPLRDWFLAEQPEFIHRIRKLVERGQVEVMTGGYYEPVLVALPEADQNGQIRKLNEAIQTDFGVRPKGLWLAERVWEPHLPRVLAQSEIDYTIVDDTHFKSVGYDDADLLGYYVTEEEGHVLKVFATSMALRYSIPWGDVDDVIKWLREQATAEDASGLYTGRQRVAVMGDDGEKFGLWPGTHRHVWQSGWMESLFTALEENSDWLETITPGNFADQHMPLGRVTLPGGSYDEMSEWALPPERAWRIAYLKHEWRDAGRQSDADFLRGAHWRNFMVKYPEINQLHKKMLWVSDKVHAMPAGELKQQALDALWAGQCNCAYWHGVFGGIYLFHIRVADYERLLAAENLADGVVDSDGRQFVEAQVVDFDRDGIDDVVLSSDQFELVFDVAHGGSLVAWDYRPAHYNLLNVLTRRREGYHRDLEEAATAGQIVVPGEGDSALENIHTTAVRARELGLEKLLFYDWYRRASLIDHFLADDVSLDDFYQASFYELGKFVMGHYEIKTRQIDENTVTVTLSRAAEVRQGEQRLPVQVQKDVTVQAGQPRLDMRYTITSRSSGTLKARFAVEHNWGLAGGESKEHAYLSIGEMQYGLVEKAAHEDVQSFAISSPLWGLSIQTEASAAFGLWRFPLETVSNSEAGFERLYQGTTTLMWWPLELSAGDSWQVDLAFEAGLL